MLEIKNVSIKLKNTDKYLIKNISLYVKNGRLIPKSELIEEEKRILFNYANHFDNYEIKIGEILYDGKNIKRIADTKKKEKLLSTIDRFQNKKRNSISNCVYKRSFSKKQNTNIFAAEMQRQMRENDSLIIDYEKTKFDSNNLKFIGRPLTDNGFTLIEMIATISILAILALITVPNVVGVAEKSKNKTYLEDAKRMVALAEYKVNSNSKYNPTINTAICINLKDLGKENFATDKGKAPNGGTYELDKSYVRVTKEYISSGTTIKYAVQLVENKNNKYFGIQSTTKKDLYINGTNQIKKNQNDNFFKNCSGKKVSVETSENLGGKTEGSDTTPNYNENIISLDIKQTSFTSCGWSIDKYFTETLSSCQDKKKTTATLDYEIRGIGSNLEYISNSGNITATVKFMNNGQQTAQIESKYILHGNDYFSVQIPMDCSSHDFREAKGKMYLHFPANKIKKLNSSFGNDEKDFLIGEKTIQANIC